MTTLYVRGVPNELYERLKRLAAQNHRSLSAQVILLLEQALRDQSAPKQQARVLARIRRRRSASPRGAPNSVTPLRADRER